MLLRNMVRYASFIITLAFIAGCSGSPPAIGPPAAMSQSQPIATQRHLSRSWMLRGVTSGDLLYVTDRTTVTVYSYPRGALVGQLTGFGILGGDCADAAGDVWIIDNQIGKVYEYRHGGTVPIATLTPPSDPLFCSVNPKNGDLAIGTGTEVLAIYPHGRGNPNSYGDASIEGFYSSSYDQFGNLFVDGLSSDYHFEFAELPKGGNTLQNIALNQSFEDPRRRSGSRECCLRRRSQDRRRLSISHTGRRFDGPASIAWS